MKNKASTRKPYIQWLMEEDRPEEAELHHACIAHACRRLALRLLGRSLNPASQLKALLLLWRCSFQDGCPSCKQTRSRSRQWAAGQPGVGGSEGEGTRVLCSPPAASLRFALETWWRLSGPGLAGRDARPLEPDPGGRYKPSLPRRGPCPAGLKLHGVLAQVSTSSMGLSVKSTAWACGSWPDLVFPLLFCFIVKPPQARVDWDILISLYSRQVSMIGVSACHYRPER